MSYLNGGHHYIYAEYNPVWCYMGWWLYAAPIVKAPRIPRFEYECPIIDKQPFYPDHDNAVWLKDDWQLDALMRSLGMTELHDYRSKSHIYTTDFLRKFPTGAVCNYDNIRREFILTLDDYNDCHWYYAKILKEWQMLKWARASSETQEKLEVLERELRKTSV